MDSSSRKLSRTLKVKGMKKAPVDYIIVDLLEAFRARDLGEVLFSDGPQPILAPCDKLPFQQW